MFFIRYTKFSTMVERYVVYENNVIKFNKSALFASALNRDECGKIITALVKSNSISTKDEFQLVECNPVKYLSPLQRKILNV